MFKRKSASERFEARERFLESSTTNVQSKIMQEAKSALELLAKNEFDVACGSLYGVLELCSILEKAINMYVTQEITPIFEANMKVSYSFEEIQKRKKDVHAWLGEISETARKLQDMLRQRKVEAVDNLRELWEKIAYDERFLDFVAVLRVTILEFEMCCARQSKNALSSLFRDLNFHPMVKKSSEKLFGERNYAQAIFEACKALINHVKERSGQRTLDGQELMGRVFGIRYVKETLQITKQPILQLNSLSSLEEIDEQEGFMHLYQGFVVGVRNPKAHVIVEQKDPFRTLEYLSLASLLTKRVDEARLNKQDSTLLSHS